MPDLIALVNSMDGIVKFDAKRLALDEGVVEEELRVLFSGKEND